MLQKQSAICIVICNLQVYNKYQNRRGGIDMIEERVDSFIDILKQLERYIECKMDRNRD